MKTKTVGVLAMVVIPAAGCAWWTPAHEADVGALVRCVLERLAAGDTVPATVAFCGAANAQQVVDILSAHRDAEARERAAGALQCAGGGDAGKAAAP